MVIVKSEGSMERSNKIIDIQESIRNHKHFNLMTHDFAEGVWEMYTSNSSFFTYFLKKERITTFNLLMSYIFSDGVSSLSEFYHLCDKNKFSGKNNAIDFVDYMVHSGRVFFIKGNDRRKKIPKLTKKGREDLDYLFSKKLNPLSLYDSTIDCKFLLSDGFYKSYFSKLNFEIFNALRWELDSTFFDKKYLLEIQSKSAGLTMLMKILLDIRYDHVNIGSPVRISYFKNLSYDMGISISHVQNLVMLLMEGGGVEKIGVKYVIKGELVKGIEHVISLILAMNYFFINFSA
jgi:hypothetical protein